MKKAFRNKLLIALSCLALTTSSCKKYLDIVPAGKTILSTFDDYNKEINYMGMHLYNEQDLRYLSDQMWINELAVIGRDPSMYTIEFLFNETQTRIPSATSTSYNYPYSYIAKYSLIIDNAGAATTGTDAQKKQLIAEARALRAYCHFVLLNMYAKPYDAATAKTDNAIIIKKSFNLEEVLSQSTVEQVYAFIESELQAAVPDLSNTPDNAFHPSKAFGYGLLAKMYLFKGQFDKAKEAAKQSLALNSYIYDLVKYYQNGQTDPVDIGMAENLYYGIGAGTVDVPYNYVISKEFYNSFDANDVRRMAFFSTTAAAVQAGSGCAAFVKSVSSTTPVRYCYNTAGLKTTDVFLILAECEARAGNVQTAIDLVDSVRRKRILPAAFTSSVATDTKSAVNMVITERRKELLFGFNRFWDQRRLGKEPDYAITVNRVFPVVNTTVPQQTYTLSPTSPLYIIPFVKDVIVNNPNMKENSQDALTW